MFYSLSRFCLLVSMFSHSTRGQSTSSTTTTTSIGGSDTGNSVLPDGNNPQQATATPSSTSSIPSAAPSWFDSTWYIPTLVLGTLSEGITFNPKLPIFVTNPWVGNLSLVLCQTGSLEPANINQENTYWIETLPLCSNPSQCLFDFTLSEETSTTYYQFNAVPALNTTNSLELNNFFFCLGIADNPAFECLSSSPLFSLLPVSNKVKRVTSGESVLKTILQITAHNESIVYYANGGGKAPVSVIPTGTTTSIGTTATVTTGTSSATATSSSSSANISNSKAASKSGLSVGEKVGIALGALALVLILLILTLFCLRRKHSKRTRQAQSSQHPTEQVMLTRSMHTDSFGRPHIITEKEEASISAAALHPGGSPTSLVGNGNVNTNGQTRHSALSPYEPLPSAPYNGSIGPQNAHQTPLPPTLSSTIPRRKPTSTSLVSRGLSTNSSISAGPVSPHTQTSSSDFEAYRDIVPVYGDARHVPQVFNAHNNENRNGSVGRGVPFLGEETEGMSSEDLARLEEEERRIDAAIAEAERR